MLTSLPPQIVSVDRTAKPLVVRLHLDSKLQILKVPGVTRRFSIAEPSPLTILSFRGARSAIRFDSATFREDGAVGPSDGLFDGIKACAEAIEDRRENVSEGSDGLDMLKPQTRAPAKKGKPKAKGKGKGKRERSLSPPTVSSSGPGPDPVVDLDPESDEGLSDSLLAPR